MIEHTEDFGASTGLPHTETMGLPEEYARHANTNVTLLIWFCGRQQYAYKAGNALITEEGEAIEGESLEYVQLVGIVTHSGEPTDFDDCPVM